MGRRKAPPTPPCDPASACVGDTVTAFVYPRRTRYNKPVSVTGRLLSIVSGTTFSLMCGGGYHTVRACDIQRITKVVPE